MHVYVEPLELGEIDRESIAAETDPIALRNMYFELRRSESELSTMIASIKLVDDAPMSMARKLGFVRIARNWVSDRLIEIGEEVPDDAYGKKLKSLRHQMTMMQQKLEANNRKLKALREENEALRVAKKVAA